MGFLTQDFVQRAIAILAAVGCFILGLVFVTLGYKQYFAVLAGARVGVTPVTLASGDRDICSQVQLIYSRIRTRLQTAHEVRRIWDVYVLFGGISLALSIMSAMDTFVISQDNGVICLTLLRLEYALCLIAIFFSNLLCCRFSNHRISKRVLWLLASCLLAGLFVDCEPSFLNLPPDYLPGRQYYGTIAPVKAGPAFIVFPLMLLPSLCFVGLANQVPGATPFAPPGTISSVIYNNELRFFSFYRWWCLIFNLTGLGMFINIYFFPAYDPPVPLHCFAFLCFFAGAIYVIFGDVLQKLYASEQYSDGTTSREHGLPCADFAASGNSDELVQQNKLKSHITINKIQMNTQITITGGQQNQVGQITNNAPNVNNQYIPKGLVPFDDLAAELTALHEAMRPRCVSQDDYLALGAISEARCAVNDRDENKVFAALARAGKWALKIAQEIGTEVLAKAIAEGLSVAS